MKLSWNSLFANGSIIDLHTSIWRARTKLKPADLGIDDSKEVQKALSLGCHRLAPSSAFEEILEPARSAARSIDHFSLNFALIRGAKYVPDSNIELLMQRLSGYKQEFNEAVDRFITNYEEMKEVQLPIIKKALLDAAKTEIAAANAYERIMMEYPTASQVRDRFSLKWSVYAVQGAKSKAALQAISEEADEVKSVVSSMVEQLRKDMKTKMESILKTAAKGGRLTDRSIDSALEMLDRVESLNILGDEVLGDQIDALRDALNKVDQKKVGKDFIKDLGDMQKQLEESAEQAVKDAEDSLTGLGKRKLNL